MNVISMQVVCLSGNCLQHSHSTKNALYENFDPLRVNRKKSEPLPPHMHMNADGHGTLIARVLPWSWKKWRILCNWWDMSKWPKFLNFWWSGGGSSKFTTGTQAQQEKVWLKKLWKGQVQLATLPNLYHSTPNSSFHIFLEKTEIFLFRGTCTAVHFLNW